MGIRALNTVGLDEVIKLGNGNTPAIDPILIDCKELNRFDLLLTIVNVIGRLQYRVKSISLISHKLAIVGNPQSLVGLPKFENVETISDENSPDRTIFILTL